MALKAKIFRLSPILIACLITILGSYTVIFKNASVWNMGSMGMFADIDAPHLRYLNIQCQSNSDKFFNYDINYLINQHPLDYEKIMSYPRQSLAEKIIKQSTFIPNEFNSCKVMLYSPVLSKNGTVLNYKESVSFNVKRN